MNKAINITLRISEKHRDKLLELKKNGKFRTLSKTIRACINFSYKRKIRGTK